MFAFAFYAFPKLKAPQNKMCLGVDSLGASPMRGRLLVRACNSTLAWRACVRAPSLISSDAYVSQVLKRRQERELEQMLAYEPARKTLQVQKIQIPLLDLFQL